MEKTRMYWCLGNEIPVEIHVRVPSVPGKSAMEDRAIAIFLNDIRRGVLRETPNHEIYVKEGNVTALNPRVIKAGRPQGKGLFLEGAVLGKDDIQKVVLRHNGKDVTRHMKQSLGPGL